jgi:hypothetical protein
VKFENAVVELFANLVVDFFSFGLFLLDYLPIRLVYVLKGLRMLVES